MTLKKLLSLQNIQIKRKFNSEKPVILFWTESDGIGILRKYLEALNKDLSFSKKGNILSVSIYRDFQYEVDTPKIDFRLITKLKKDLKKFPYEERYLYSIEPINGTEKLLLEDISKIVSDYAEKIKNLEKREKGNDDKKIEDFSKLLKEYNLTYKIFKRMKRLEDKIFNFDKLGRLK